MSSKTDLLSLARERGLTAKVSLDEPLSKHTSYRIGGPADLFIAVKDTRELCSWVALARELEQPFLVMGKGTNLLIADRGYRGLVIKNQCLDYTMDPASSTARAEAGVILARLARQSAQEVPSSTTPAPTMEKRGMWSVEFTYWTARDTDAPWLQGICSLGIAPVASEHRQAGRRSYCPPICTSSRNRPPS